uniref:RING-type domain-containing protein n=1 Tax=Malurus cyaneus samueli TaxID=2593467 RepID=A0A8C5UBH5_9PASS
LASAASPSTPDSTDGAGQARGSSCQSFRICRICVSPIQSRAAVEPCGHVFCRACIQQQAAPGAAATCPVCREPIGAIRLLQGQDNRAGPAPRRRRRLHPFWKHTAAGTWGEG